ncbi:MAG: tetratricopeptide repeat protein [Pseudomonadota bacterium]
MLAAFAWAWASASSANAETLEVVVHDPANEALIGNRILALDFTNSSRWAERWSGNLRSMMIGANLLGEKMFVIPIPARPIIADLVVTGELTLDVDYFEVEPEVSRECAAEDDGGNCTSWEEKVRQCAGLAIFMEGYVRFERAETRETVLGFSDQDEERRISCELGGPTLGGSPEAMLDRMVERARAAIFPALRRDAIRIRESRKSLEGEDRSAFKQAVKLTDDDPDSACKAFADLLTSNPDNVSLLFNSGLCAERRGEYDAAYDLYVEALRLAPGESYPELGVERMQRAAYVERQYERHFGLQAPAVTTVKSGFGG